MICAQKLYGASSKVIAEYNIHVSFQEVLVSGVSRETKGKPAIVLDVRSFKELVSKPCPGPPFFTMA